MKIIDKILSDRNNGELKRGSVKGIQRKKKKQPKLKHKTLRHLDFKGPLWLQQSVWGPGPQLFQPDSMETSPSGVLMEEFESPEQQEAAEGY